MNFKIKTKTFVLVGALLSGVYSDLSFATVTDSQPDSSRVNRSPTLKDILNVNANQILHGQIFDRARAGLRITVQGEMYQIHGVSTENYAGDLQFSKTLSPDELNQRTDHRNQFSVELSPRVSLELRTNYRREIISFTLRGGNSIARNCPILVSQSGARRSTHRH